MSENKKTKIGIVILCYILIIYGMVIGYITGREQSRIERIQNKNKN